MKKLAEKIKQIASGKKTAAVPVRGHAEIRQKLGYLFCNLLCLKD